MIVSNQQEISEYQCWLLIMQVSEVKISNQTISQCFCVLLTWKVIDNYLIIDDCLVVLLVLISVSSVRFTLALSQKKEMMMVTMIILMIGWQRWRWADDDRHLHRMDEDAVEKLMIIINHKSCDEMFPIESSENEKVFWMKINKEMKEKFSSSRKSFQCHL